MSASQLSADPDLQDFLSGLHVVQTPSASATPRAGVWGFGEAVPRCSPVMVKMMKRGELRYSLRCGLCEWSGSFQRQALQTSSGGRIQLLFLQVLSQDHRSRTLHLHSHRLLRESSRGERIYCVSPGDLMVVKGGNLAFLDPRVPGSRISKEVTQTWITESKTLREWNVLFAHANFTDVEADDDSVEDIKVSRPFTHTDISAKEDEFAAQANLFRMPLKRK
eukprot:scaffold6421_cov28-Attheya_sp.AAC.1